MIPKHPEFEEAQAAMPFGWRFLNVGEEMHEDDYLWYDCKWNECLIAPRDVRGCLVRRKADAGHAPHGYRLLQHGEVMRPDDLMFFSPPFDVRGWHVPNRHGCPACAHETVRLDTSFHAPRARKRDSIRTETTPTLTVSREIYVVPSSISFSSRPLPPIVPAVPDNHRILTPGEELVEGDMVWMDGKWSPIVALEVVKKLREHAWNSYVYARKEEPKWPAIFEYVGQNSLAHGELVLVNAKGDGTVVLSKDSDYPVAHVYRDMIHGVYNLNKWWKRRDDLRSFYIKLDK